MEFIKHKGERIPRIGLGTWCIGENPEHRIKEAETFHHAISRYNITLLDTAEMYGLGKSEQFLSHIIKDYDRERLFIIDKILPQNVIEDNFEQSIKKSLDNLGVSYIDLYLLHWRENVDLQFMVDKMERYVDIGLIKHWGVSNFDVTDMEDLFKCKNGSHCFANQVLYNISERGIEYDLIDWCHNNQVLIIAYSTLGDNSYYRREIDESKIIKQITDNYGINKYNLLLKFAIRNRNMIALFKTSSCEHLEKNMTDIWVKLDDNILRLIDEEFPMPNHKVDLQKI